MSYNMNRYQQVKAELRQSPKTWLVTGVAGFIGSNLLETLLQLDQRVIGLDNFATGHQRNLDEVRTLVTPGQWANFHFIYGDIRKLADCQKAMYFGNYEDKRDVLSRISESTPTVDYVLHQAALGSVPRSLADPINTNETNLTGFLNMLVAARDANVKSFTYAASSSTYGDHPDLPKTEEKIGNPLSPYAVTKHVNELYAKVFYRNFNYATVGLRYFNVFGPRQDPNGAYAAVIPKWSLALLNNDEITINGDGLTSRDFCFVSNVVQANILSAFVKKNDGANIYNVAVGERTSLNDLFEMLKNRLDPKRIREPIYGQFRNGDVTHSLASIEKIKKDLGYEPTFNVNEGIKLTCDWFEHEWKKR